MRLLPRFPSRLTAAVLLVSAASVLSGCSTLKSWTPDFMKSENKDAAVADTTGVQTAKERRFLGILSPYRVDIQQGNFISKEMVAQVRESMAAKDGMTREQVAFVLGTPLVTDAFHEDRWDYVFRLEKNNGDIIQSRVTAFFTGNKLVKLEAGEQPSEVDYLAMIAGKVPLPPPPVETNGLDSPKKPTGPSSKQ